jgi:sialate O-acetylesterase
MKNSIKYGFISFIICSALIFVSFTKISSSIKLASLFTDNMVIQQNDTLVIWGWSQEGTVIKAESTWGAKSNAITSIHGRWSIQIPTPKADNIEHSLNISTKDTLINIQNILLGEVWLCSGQSNMEMPMKGFQYNKPYEYINNSEYEIKNANYPQIRMFTVKRKVEFSPQDTCEGAWVVCSPQTVSEFSATAYFFGKELHNKLNVPVGLIHSSWGGTPAQSWAQVDYVEKIDEFKNIKNQLATANDKNSSFNKWLASMIKVEWDSLILVDKMKWIDNRNKDLLKSGFDDSNWKTLNLKDVSTAFEKDNFNGIGWLRQSIFIDSLPPSGFTVNLGKTDDLYAFFINGILVARKEYWGESNNRYTIPENLLKSGINDIAIRFIDVWGRGGFEEDSQRGIYYNEKKYSSFNDQWKFKRTAVLIDQEFYNLNNGNQIILKPSPDRLSKIPHSPTVLYNAMIAPLIPYPIKGVIWYQGESNRGKPKQYQTLFPAVIDSWRKQWNRGNFPFYYVQIAPFNYNEEVPSLAAELREAQFLTLSKENVGMAVTMDIGSVNSIHPGNKKDVGQRLALWALAKDYKKSEVVYSGPLYKDVEFNGKKAIVSFEHIGSALYSPDIDLSYFELAGEDLKFHPAKAHIKEDKVIVQSSKVLTPSIVRYAWKDSAMPNLYNKEGLPASSFRSSNQVRAGLEELYPPDSTIIKYHTDWTKNHYKERINAFQKDPLYFGDVVFLGNSITEGGNNWSAKLGVENVKNRGISGDITDGVLKRLDEITYFKPKAVFILIGINDLFNIHYQKKIPSAEYVGNNILKIAKILSGKVPNTMLYIQTILPTDKEFINENIIRVNKMINFHKKEGKYNVVDLYSQFTDESGFIKRELTYDGTHLNTVGYDLWVKQVKPFLNK